MWFICVHTPRNTHSLTPGGLLRTLTRTSSWCMWRWQRRKRHEQPAMCQAAAGSNKTTASGKKTTTAWRKVSDASVHLVGASGELKGGGVLEVPAALP